MQNDRFAGRTKNSRTSAVKKYEEVCKNAKVDCWPATADSIEIFAAWLKAKMPSSGGTYLSLLKQRIEDSSMSFPTSQRDHNLNIKSIEASRPPKEQERGLHVDHFRRLFPIGERE